jgi:hypothetical protein
MRGGGSCIDPRFLDLDTSGQWSASLPGRFNPGERAADIHCTRGWVGPQSRFERRGQEKILDPTETRTPTPEPSSPYPVAIPTALSRLLF